MSQLLSVHRLFKHYPQVKAVNGISFDLPSGICFGLLGPNGAGKTTTIEMLEGITAPTSGSILYKGEPLGTRFREEAGIMFQHTALQEFISVRETLVLFTRLYKHSMPVDELITRFELTPLLHQDTRKLSGGQKQRLLLAIALLNNPEIVFLDEPTTGLDPKARRDLWQQVENVKAMGKTIILTTHYMEEAYQLCDDIAIMQKGEIIARGGPDELLAEHFDDVIVQLPLKNIPTDFDCPFINTPRGDWLEIFAPDSEAAIAWLAQSELPLKGLRLRERTLEDLFLALTYKEQEA